MSYFRPVSWPSRMAVAGLLLLPALGAGDPGPVAVRVVEEAGVNHTGVFTLTERGQFGEVAEPKDAFEHLHSFCYPGVQGECSALWGTHQQLVTVFLPYCICVWDCCRTKEIR